MEVVVINCSPKKSKGNTALILEPFMQGMQKAGAKVELYYAKDLTIKPCLGKYECWFKYPGKCVYDDDMHMILDRLKNASIWVFATPVHTDGVSGLMKNLMDRMLPLVEPFFELRRGRCHQPVRKGIVKGKIVLVSSCGRWELDNFDPLQTHMKSFCRSCERDFAGALLRPHAEALRHLLEQGKEISDIFDAAHEAGQQLIKNEKMSPRTLKIVSRELLSQRAYILYFNREIKRYFTNLEKDRRKSLESTIKVKAKPHAFSFRGSRDINLNTKIVDTINLMGCTGDDAEAKYQSSLNALRSRSEDAVAIIVKEYRNLPASQYLGRWSIVQLISELRDRSALSFLNEILSAPIPAERSKTPHRFSTRGREIVIRTTAIEAIKQISATGDKKANELLLKYTTHKNFSVKRAAIQSFLEVGGKNARITLMKILPKKEQYILNIKRIDVKKVPQQVIISSYEVKPKLQTPSPCEKLTSKKKRIDDTPKGTDE